MRHITGGTWEKFLVIMAGCLTSLFNLSDLVVQLP